MKHFLAVLIFGFLIPAWGAGPESPRFEPRRDSSDACWVGRGFGYGVQICPTAAELRSASGSNLRMRFDHGSTPSVIRGESALSSVSNYFNGADPSRWRRGVHQWATLRAEGVYPGIDLLYHSERGSLEFDFVIAPGADPNLIHMSVEGREIVVDNQGDLRDSQSGELLLGAPRAYEVDESGQRVSIPSAFRRERGHQVGFRVRRRNRAKTLVIDPIVTYGTYLGGTGSDTVVAVEQGSDGSSYVAGQTTSVDLPQAVSLDSLLNRPITLFLSRTTRPMERSCTRTTSAAIARIWLLDWPWIRKGGPLSLAARAAITFPRHPERCIGIWKAAPPTRSLFVSAPMEARSSIQRIWVW
jgi:hypothetical protein